MSKTVNLSIRMDQDLKNEADQMFKELGLGLTTAITMFVRQSVRERKIPFEISLRENDHELERIRLDAIKAVAEIRQEAQENGLDKITLDELNDEIRAMRAERKAREDCA